MDPLIVYLIVLIGIFVAVLGFTIGNIVGYTRGTRRAAYMIREWGRAMTDELD